MNKNLLLVASLVLVLCPSVQAAASINPTVVCTNIADSSVTFEACAAGFFDSPSPAEFANGTKVYLGGYDYDYKFYKLQVLQRVKKWRRHNDTFECSVDESLR